MDLLLFLDKYCKNVVKLAYKNFEILFSTLNFLVSEKVRELVGEIKYAFA